MNHLVTASSGGTGSLLLLVGYIAFFAILMYFLAIRPQKKQQQKQKAMLETMEIGDAVLTNAGMCGIIIGMDEENVVVEFGNNKNCRIPMRKEAIVEVEKAKTE